MVSMLDIAKAANVSRTTVSLVLNNRTAKGVSISEETRQKVRIAAEKLGYRPNVLAASVAKGKSRIIGCVGLDVDEEVALSVSQLVTTAVRYATERDYSIKLMSSNSSIQELVDTCISYRMCGVLMRTRIYEKYRELAAKLQAHNIPMILLDSAFNDPCVPSVVCDDYDGMRQGVEYLASLGHRNITYITFEDFQPFSIRRNQGFKDTVKRLKSKVNGRFCNTDTKEPIDPFDRAEAIVHSILESDERPDAFACNCDEIAMIVLRAAWRCGIKVPEELSVIGFGNLPTDRFSAPQLTSLALPYRNMCEHAIDLLLSGDTKPREIILPVSIKIRESTAPKSSVSEAAAPSKKVSKLEKTYN